jgi:hypothetical protein
LAPPFLFLLSPFYFLISGGSPAEAEFDLKSGDVAFAEAVRQD